MKLFAGVFLLVFSLPSHADVSYTQFLTMKDQNASKLYVTGMEAGFGFSNAYAAKQFGKDIYCQPQTLALNYDNLVHLMERFVEKIPDLKDLPVEAVLLMTLVDAFPCKN